MEGLIHLDKGIGLLEEGADKLRAEGHKNAGRLAECVWAERDREKFIAEIRRDYELDPKKARSDCRYVLSAFGNEFTFYDFLVSELSDIIPVSPFESYVEGINNIRYFEVFAKYDDPHFIDAISRMTDDDVRRIYIDNYRLDEIPETKEYKLQVFKEFLDRNFPDRNIF